MLKKEQKKHKKRKQNGQYVLFFFIDDVKNDYKIRLISRVCNVSWPQSNWPHSTIKERSLKRTQYVRFKDQQRVLWGSYHLISRFCVTSESKDQQVSVKRRLRLFILESWSEPFTFFPRNIAFLSLSTLQTKDHFVFKTCMYVYACMEFLWTFFLLFSVINCILFALLYQGYCKCWAEFIFQAIFHLKHNYKCTFQFCFYDLSFGLSFVKMCSKLAS